MGSEMCIRDRDFKELEKLIINKNISDEFLTISIAGELDASTSIALDDEIKIALEDHKKKILVDCHDLTYISSAGLGVFVSHLSDVQSDNGQFVLYGLTEDVFDTFKILGLHDILTIADNEQEAKSFFA